MSGDAGHAVRGYMLEHAGPVVLPFPYYIPRTGSSFMGRILAFTLPAPGHIFPFASILLELKKRGHRVQMGICTQSRGLADISGIPVSEMLWQPTLQVAGSERRGSSSASDAQVVRFSALGESLAILLERLIDRERPDFLLVDPMLWGTMIAAEASGVKWASLAHNPMMMRGLGIDVRGPGLPPPTGMIQRIWYRAIHSAICATNLRYVPAINAVRVARGLRPLRNRMDLFHTAPLTIATTVEPFEYPRTDWPPSISFIGPLLWEPPASVSHWDAKLGDQPLILLAGSSVRDTSAINKSLQRVTFQALADENVRIIATMPCDELPTSVPRNVSMHTFIPHGQVLPLTSVVICHGGPGITQKALAAGVPVVAVPSGYDRFEVARRVEVAGAGVMLPLRHLTPDRLKAAVRQALTCKGGAERVADAFRRAGGAPAGADAIDSMLLARQADATC